MCRRVLMIFFSFCLAGSGWPGSITASDSEVMERALVGQSDSQDMDAKFAQGKSLWQERDYVRALEAFLQVVEQSDREDLLGEIAQLTGGRFQAKKLAMGKNPTFSPDGRQVAFESDADGDWEIYTIDCDGKNLRQWTHNDASDVRPAFSPDGKRLAFGSDRDGDRGIYLLDLGSGKERRLSRGEGSDPIFSPDSKRIAFDCWGKSDAAVHLIDLESGKEIELRSKKKWNYSHMFSPDGSKLLFFAWNWEGKDEKGLVVIADVDGSKQMVLHESEAAYPPLDFSPDSKLVASISPEGIYLLSVDGESREHLSHNEGDTWDWGPSFSPDGKKLLFYSGSKSGNREEVRAVDLVDMKEYRVAEMKSGIEWVKFSPTGRRILIFKRDPSVYLVNPDGSELVELDCDIPRGIREIVPIYDATFSPDDQQILLPFGEQIYLMDVEPLRPVAWGLLTARLRRLLREARSILEAPIEGAGITALPPDVSLDSADLDSRVEYSLQFAGQQLRKAVFEVRNYDRYPASTNADGVWKTTDSSIGVTTRGGWTIGFFPGCLWHLYEATSDDSWRQWAESWTAGLEIQKDNTLTHDVGFFVFCTFGNGYHLTGNEDYRDIVIQTAHSLATRYNSTVGCIKTGDWGKWKFPVFIDNMMNLQLLFWASKNGGEQEWYDMAHSHALRTMQDHIREDGGSYHVVDYDPATGSILGRGTFQGSSDESTWSRGQAWGLYGFTVAYRETDDVRFLETAQKLADYFIDRLPPDQVPYWDFQAPDIPNEERDSSAAAIAASGLLELSTLVSEPDAREKYKDAASAIVNSLCSPAYLAVDANSSGILLHGVGSRPHKSEVDVSLIYGDYYFIEALLRYKRIISSTSR